MSNTNSIPVSFGIGDDHTDGQKDTCRTLKLTQPDSGKYMQISSVFYSQIRLHRIKLTHQVSKDLFPGKSALDGSVSLQYSLQHRSFFF